MHEEMSFAIKHGRAITIKRLLNDSRASGYWIDLDKLLASAIDMYRDQVLRAVVCFRRLGAPSGYCYPGYNIHSPSQYLNVIQRILEAGADPESKNANGEDAYMHARRILRHRGQRLDDVIRVLDQHRREPPQSPVRVENYELQQDVPSFRMQKLTQRIGQLYAKMMELFDDANVASKSNDTETVDKIVNMAERLQEEAEWKLREGREEQVLVASGGRLLVGQPRKKVKANERTTVQNEALETARDELLTMKGLVALINSLLGDIKAIAASLTPAAPPRIQRANKQSPNFEIEDVDDFDPLSNNEKRDNFLAAASGGNLEALRWVFESATNPERQRIIDARDSHGMTALMLATISGNADMVRYLLANNANRNLRYNMTTAYEMAKQNPEIRNLLRPDPAPPPVPQPAPPPVPQPAPPPVPQPAPPPVSQPTGVDTTNRGQPGPVNPLTSEEFDHVFARYEALKDVPEIINKDADVNNGNLGYGWTYAQKNLRPVSGKAKDKYWWAPRWYNSAKTLGGVIGPTSGYYNSEKRFLAAIGRAPS
jgi:hypothetical protein